MTKLELYMDSLSFHGFNITLLASKNALLYVGLADQVEDYRHFFEKHLQQDLTISHQSHALDIYKNQLTEYVHGQRQEFNLPLEILGTPFQKKVFQAMKDISFGTSLTYGELGQRAGYTKKASRSIGGAVGKNPLMIILPCHRVLGANGRLTGYRGGLRLKKFLLDLEGIGYKK